jgi:hypothetical protein
MAFNVSISKYLDEIFLIRTPKCFETDMDVKDSGVTSPKGTYFRSNDIIELANRAA